MTVKDVVVLCGDAVDYELTDEPAVVYIYNFETPVMRKVRCRLQHSSAGTRAHFV